MAGDAAVLGILALATGLIAVLLTGAVRNAAIAGGVIDHPNERSSHIAPTPRGGGLAIVAAATVALAFLTWVGRLELRVLMALIGGGVLVAAVGFVDDRRPLSARLRLVVHFAAAAWALACLGGLPPVRIGASLYQFGWVGYPLGAIGIVWVLNLFNFMDGIDGIAGSQAAFVAVAGACLLAGGLPTGGVPAAALVFGFACLGFLWWNWPPAKIFMGDVGSGYLGFFIAVVAIATARENSIALFVWLILGAVFFVDATFTFFRRLARGEHVSVAHRSHAYQSLARRWNSHRRVTVIVSTINLLWLLPLAWMALTFPAYAGWITLGALGPVLAGVALGGGGRIQ